MEFEVESTEVMNDLAGRVARQLQAGDVLELVGDVGTGKTTFTKALAAALGVTETVQSPTFMISSVYDTSGGVQLAHYDFYRLNEPGVMRDELSEALASDSTITVLEWADVVADVLPADRLTVYFDYLPDESARAVRLEAHGTRAEQTIEGLKA